MSGTKPRLAVIGGTGSQGGGLALRWAGAGYEVVIGSRTEETAREGAAALNAILGKDLVRGFANADAAHHGQVVLLAVPYAVQQETALSVFGALRGKLLIDVTAPIVPPKVRTVQLPSGGSAVQQLHEWLGAAVRVVSAFQNVAAAHLRQLDKPIYCDVLVSADEEADAQVVIRLAEAAGLRGLHAGPLANSAAAEALTAVILTINRQFKVPCVGIQFTGLPEHTPSAT